MTRDELEKLPALYIKRNRLRMEIKEMARASYPVTDVVKGGSAINGKGRTIIIEGTGHPLLPKKKQDEYDCNNDIYNLEQWLDNLPEDTSEQSIIKSILIYKYIYNWTNEEIGKELHYDESGIRKKINRFFDVSDYSDSE